MEGQVVRGWKIGKFIDEGSYGEVYVTEHETRPGLKAIKILQPQYRENSIVRSDFLTSARLCDVSEGLLSHPNSHPNIYKIYDAGGETERMPFYVTDIYEKSLKKYLTETKIIDQTELKKRIEMLATILDALAHAHSKGVLHRDIKAENIMIDKNGNLVVVDFDLARIVYKSQEWREFEKRSTPSLGRQNLVGIPEGMSFMRMHAPKELEEGFEKGYKEPCTDIYYANLLGWEMLTGRDPGKSHGKTMSQINPEIESFPDLEQIIQKGADWDPDQRYKNAIEEKNALEHMFWEGYKYVSRIKSLLSKKGEFGIIPPENLAEIIKMENELGEYLPISKPDEKQEAQETIRAVDKCITEYRKKLDEFFPSVGTDNLTTLKKEYGLSDDRIESLIRLSKLLFEKERLRGKDVK